jgi:hypothetical protein
MPKDDLVRLRHMLDSAIGRRLFTKSPCRARLTRHNWCVRRTLRLPMAGEIKYADQQTLRESLSNRVKK